MTTYPCFVPPSHLAERTPREWSTKEARQYATWFHAERPVRVQALLSFLGLDSQPAESLLEIAGARAADRLRTAEFSEPRAAALTLTDRGYALAADMGLLVAELVEGALGDAARWEVLMKPKSAAAFHLPILITANPVFFEPVGASIGQAHGVLRGDRDAGIWKEMYQHLVGGRPGARAPAPAR